MARPALRLARHLPSALRRHLIGAVADAARCIWRSGTRPDAQGSVPGAGMPFADVRHRAVDQLRSIAALGLSEFGRLKAELDRALKIAGHAVTLAADPLSEA